MFTRHLSLTKSTTPDHSVLIPFSPSFLWASGDLRCEVDDTANFRRALVVVDGLRRAANQHEFLLHLTKYTNRALSLPFAHPHESASTRL
jgi:hypothetical protein